jgi:hypothetical protein
MQLSSLKVLHCVDSLAITVEIVVSKATNKYKRRVIDFDVMSCAYNVQCHSYFFLRQVIVGTNYSDCD